MAQPPVTGWAEGVAGWFPGMLHRGDFVTVFLWRGWSAAGRRSPELPHAAALLAMTVVLVGIASRSIRKVAR